MDGLKVEKRSFSLKETSVTVPHPRNQFKMIFTTECPCKSASVLKTRKLVMTFAGDTVFVVFSCLLWYTSMKLDRFTESHNVLIVL